MLQKDIPERFLDGPFQYEELRNRVSANVGEKLAGQDEKTKMSMQFNSVVRTIGPIRNTCKSRTTSDNPSIVGLPTRHHQRHVNRLQETRNPGVMRRNRVRGRRSVSSAASVVERLSCQALPISG